MLPASNELIWCSRARRLGPPLPVRPRAPGKLKNRITTGEGNVGTIVRVDEKARQLWFRGVGKEPGRDPYFLHLYRIGLDGRGQALLTPEDGDHDVTLSPDRRRTSSTATRRRDARR